MDILTLGTGTNYRAFNTKGTNGAPITLAGTPAIRASINGGDYVNAGLTLVVDHDFNGASAVTGLHRVAINVDDATLALAAGDRLVVILSAGTVDSVSVAGTKLFEFEIVPEFARADLHAVLGAEIAIGGDAPASPIGFA